MKPRLAVRENFMSARLLLAAFLAAAGTVTAADLAKVTRTIGKEPAYQTKTPRYLLLAFGPDAAERVWLVQDGDTLYVDRNGNGDLTDPGEKIATKKRPDSDPDVDGRSFDVGDIAAGGRTHKGLVVNTIPLSRMADDIRDLPHARQLLRADSKAQIVSLTLEVRHPVLKGPGVEGRVPMLVGPLDLGGMLVFAASPKDAPIIHPDGALEITFYGGLPTLQIGRETDVVLAVGSPGLGKGTLAMLAYEQTIPADLRPTVEITYPSAKAGDAPFKEPYELRDRC
jgi:hypothetical protein